MVVPLFRAYIIRTDMACAYRKLHSAFNQRDATLLHCIELATVSIRQRQVGYRHHIREHSDLDTTRQYLNPDDALKREAATDFLSLKG